MNYSINITDDDFVNVTIFTDLKTRQQIQEWCYVENTTSLLMFKSIDNSIVLTFKNNSKEHNNFIERFLPFLNTVPLNEIEVSYQQSILPPSDYVIDKLRSSSIQGTYNGHIIKCIFIDQLYIYSIFDGDVLKSYFGIYWNDVLKVWGAKQAWTNPIYQRQGLSTTLMEYVITVDNKSPMISDFQMSHMAVGRLSKMIKKGLIKFNILDVETRSILAMDKSIPIYDEKVSDHKVATYGERYRYVWLMSKDELSTKGVPETSEVVQEMIRDFKPNINK